MDLLEAAENLLKALDTITTEDFSLGGEREARVALRKAIKETPSPRIVIEMEGGLIQNITANVKAEVLVLDADTEGGDEDRIKEIANWDGSKEEVYSSGIEEPEVLPEYVPLPWHGSLEADRLIPILHRRSKPRDIRDNSPAIMPKRPPSVTPMIQMH